MLRYTLRPRCLEPITEFLDIRFSRGIDGIGEGSSLRTRLPRHIRRDTSCRRGRDVGRRTETLPSTGWRYNFRRAFVCVHLCIRLRGRRTIFVRTSTDTLKRFSMMHCPESRLDVGIGLLANELEIDEDADYSRDYDQTDNDHEFRARQTTFRTSADNRRRAGGKTTHRWIHQRTSHRWIH